MRRVSVVERPSEQRGRYASLREQQAEARRLRYDGRGSRVKVPMLHVLIEPTNGKTTPLYSRLQTTEPNVSFPFSRSVTCPYGCDAAPEEQQQLSLAGQAGWRRWQ